MEDLREKTHSQHYELYRKKRLEEMGFADDHGSVVCGLVRHMILYSCNKMFVFPPYLMPNPPPGVLSEGFLGKKNAKNTL